MLIALTWGLVAASSLIIGSIAGVVRDWNRRLVGLVLGFGAGALVAAISFELAGAGFQLGGPLALSLGLAGGAVVFYVADVAIDRMGFDTRQAAGVPLALGALLDGIPEQSVIGIGIAGGAGVSAALMVAIVVSNLPEAIGSASDLKGDGHRPTRIVLGWSGVALLSAAATVAGFELNEFAPAGLQGSIYGFAGGALLVMLVGSMIPDATQKAGKQAGLAAVLGFAVAAGLSLAG